MDEIPVTEAFLGKYLLVSQLSKVGASAVFLQLLLMSIDCMLFYLFVFELLTPLKVSSLAGQY